MADVNNPPARGGIAKRKRGRPRRVPLDAAPVASAPIPAQGNDSRSSSASGSNKNMNDLEEHINDLGDSWETESLFEDVLDDLAEDNEGALTDIEACTAEECARFRQQLRAIGPEEFCRRTVDAGTITAKRLLTAFNIRPPAFLEGEPDESYFGLLSLALSRELLKRAKLPEYNSVDDAVRLIQKSRNIVVLTGAGISTSLGIPDFRSKETGLYSRLEHLGLSDPQEVFDIQVFKDDPRIFYSVARDILPSTDRFTPTHAFIAMLQQQGKLLTNYSQNIDNLEAKAGILPSKLIQCHGSFATATCVTCGYRVEGESIYPTIKAGQIPRCPRCAAGKPRGGSAAAAAAATARKQRKALVRESSSRAGSLSRSNSVDNTPSASSTPSSTRGRGRPRGRPPGKVGRPRGRPRRQKRGGSSDDDDDDADSDFNPGRGGVMKPDITFFGEALPDEFSRRLTEHDRDKADLVVVIGTSLKVAPVSEVVPFMPPHVPAIYVSRTPVSHINFDIDLLGDCDVVVSELCRRAGWDFQHEMIPPNQQITVDTVVGFNSRHLFTDVTPGRVKEETAATATTAIAAAPFVPKVELEKREEKVVEMEDLDPDATDDDLIDHDTIEVEDIDVDADDDDNVEDVTELSAASTSIAVATTTTPDVVKTDVIMGIREIQAASSSPDTAATAPPTSTPALPRSLPLDNASAAP
ncbi:NAD-dependent histone deacetylase sir2 [Sporothrix stenoceras]|uniref:NAD-dependent histone deacetylase sir2 n=1 Tax=Sporothrix stenoceras TaxID=5173 RepID=A0ABR3ZP96_9PEZI